MNHNVSMISPDQVFQIANPLALCGWIWLLVWIFLPTRMRERTRFAGLLVPIALSVIYTGSALAYFGTGSGGFDTLDGVLALFTNRGIAVAGWVHYLAFDLVVGWCIAQHALSQQIHRLLIIPCLLLTFMLGPMGLLVYVTIHTARKLTKSTNGETT